MDEDDSCSNSSFIEPMPRLVACLELFQVHDYLIQLKLRNTPGHDVFLQIGERTIPCHKCVLQKRSSFFRNIFRTFSGVTHIDVSGIDYDHLNALCNVLYFGSIIIWDEDRKKLCRLLHLFKVENLQELKITFERTTNPLETYDYEKIDHKMKATNFVIKLENDELRFIDSRDGLDSKPLIQYPSGSRGKMLSRKLIHFKQQENERKSRMKKRWKSRKDKTFHEIFSTKAKFTSKTGVSSEQKCRSRYRSLSKIDLPTRHVMSKNVNSSRRKSKTESSTSNVTNQREESPTALDVDDVYLDDIVANWDNIRDC